jgi:UPF0176 protein
MEPPSPPKIVVSAMYRFATLPDHESLRAPLLQIMQKHNIKGSLLLAKEGINGTIAGPPSAITETLAHLKSIPQLSALTHKESYHSTLPFTHQKVLLKKEIVTMGLPNLDPLNVCGTYCKPNQWNTLISDPNTTLIDTRNEYEIQTGTFQNAVNPQISTFVEFPKWVEKNLDPKTHKKIAMYCTGGIRCEKSTAYLKGLGFNEVYHLEGGILKYLEEVEKEKSMWEGECYVFDQRVTVDHDLKRGKYDKCFGCRRPVSGEDKVREEYQFGLSCHRCWGALSEKQKLRFAEREKQFEKAEAGGKLHIGMDAKFDAKVNKEEKVKKREKDRLANLEMQAEKKLKGE